jgi:hypothetical protein
MNNNLAWSLLDPKPIMALDLDYDAHLCFWNSHVITRTYARMIIATAWSNIFHTPAVKISAQQEMMKYISLGVFDQYPSECYSVKSYKIDSFNGIFTRVFSDKEFLQKLKSQYDPMQAFTWTMQEPAILVKREKVFNDFEF